MGVQTPVHGALDAWRTAVARAQRHEAVARVVWIGDSAVVGDGPTGAWRRILQARLGDAGHGFVAAGKPWPWYRHRDVENDGAGWTYETVLHPGRDHLFGLPFLRADTRGAASASWRGTASHFELWSLARPHGGSVDVRIDRDEPREVRTEAAAREARYDSFDVPDGPHTFDVATRGDGPVSLFGATLDRGTWGARVDAIGVNGAQARQFLFADEPFFEAHVRHRGADLVVVQLGTNLADGTHAETHGAQLRTLVQRLRHAAPEASCLVLAPFDRSMNGAGTPDYIPAMVEQARLVADATHCAYWDTFAAMGGRDSFVQWHRAGLAAGDEMHLTHAGYDRIADLFDAALAR